MTTIKTSFTIGKRTNGRSFVSQKFIGSKMKTTDHFKIIIQYLIKILIFFSCFCQDHNEIKSNSSDIESSGEYWSVVLISRIHATSLIPGG